jgi:hypothetical protein
MKRLLVILLVAVPLFGATEQKQKRGRLQGISVFAGGAWSRYSVLPSVATIPEIHLAMGNNAGASAGFLLEYYFSDHVSVDNGLQYVRAGAAVNWYYFDEPRGSWSYDLDLVSFPVTFRFKPWLRSSPYVLAGYDLSIIARHRLIDSTGSTGSIVTDLDNGTYDFDIRLIGGAGAEVALKKLTPFVEFRYYLGLLDISNGKAPLESYARFKTRSFVLLAGIRFRLKQRAGE